MILEKNKIYYKGKKDEKVLKKVNIYIKILFLLQ